MDILEQWNEHRTRIPPGKYLLKCIKAGKERIWHQGEGGPGGSQKVVLWFEVVEGEQKGKIVPMFLRIGDNGKVPQGSKYYVAWCIANGLRRPPRARIKEMPPLKFRDKVFNGEVVDVKPLWIKGMEQPSLFHYSRVDIVYELVLGDPNS